MGQMCSYNPFEVCYIEDKPFLIYYTLENNEYYLVIYNLTTNQIVNQTKTIHIEKELWKQQILYMV